MTSIEWIGLDEWTASIAQMQQTVPAKGKDIMQQLGQDGLEIMEEHTPVGTRATKKHRPGTLKEADTLTETEDGFELSNAAENGEGDVYSSFVNDGTSKMRAQPFLDPAVEYISSEMDTRLPTVFDEI